jgi:hypothetical protein
VLNYHLLVNQLDKHHQLLIFLYNFRLVVFLDQQDINGQLDQNKHDATKQELTKY